MCQRLLFLTLLNLSILTTYGQYLDLDFVQVGKEKGLSNSKVTCITQDRDGFIWIGTQDGLNRFNGYSIEIFKNGPEENSLPHNHIRSIFTDSEGKVWVGTENGLCWFNPSTYNFQSIDIKIDSLENELFRISIIRENRGKIYYAIAKELFELDKNTLEIRKFLSIGQGEISAVAFDTKNYIWVAGYNAGGLTKFDYTGKKIKQYLPALDRDGKELASSVFDITFRGENKLWIATDNDGLYVLDVRYETYKQYFQNSGDDRYVRFVYVDNQYRLWAGSFTGLKLYNDTEDQFYGLYNDYNDPYSIHPNAWGIFHDKQNNYWSLHKPGGIGLAVVKKGFKVFNDKTLGTWNTTTPNISSVEEDSLGNLWLANPYNGIDIFHWIHGKTYRLNHEPGNENSLGGGATFDMQQDVGGMWIVSNRGGLQFLDGNLKDFTNYSHNPADTNSIAGNDVRSISPGSDNSLWLTTHGQGVDKFLKDEERFIHYNVKNAGLSNNWTTEAIETTEGILWVGTVYGLSKLHPDSSRFENFYRIDGDSATLSNNEITTLFEDAIGRLWVGTISGLNLYNTSTNRFERIKGRLGQVFVCAILDDANGDIWVSSLSGLYRYSPTTLGVSRFDETDGLPSTEFSVRSRYKNLLNDLFFGSINGVVLFDPNDLIYNTHKPHVEISGVRLFNKQVQYYEGSPILSEHVSQAEKMELDYTQNMITFMFTAINMAHPEKNQYAYRLDNFDEDWHYVGTRREATYTNLDPGEYTFRVIASNNDNVWNTEGASIKIIVNPPWWQTWWFRILATIISVSLLIGVFLLRTQQLRIQKRILSEKVRKSTNELRESNQELQNKTEHLNETNTLLEERQQQIMEQSEKLQELNTTKDRLFSIIAHDLTSPFNSIIGYAELLNSSFDSLSKEEKKKMIVSIHESSRRVYGLLDNLLNWAKSQTDRIVFEPEFLDLRAIIEESLEIFSERIKHKNIDFQIKATKDVLAYVDSNMIKTVIRNLLSNAIKYTPQNGVITATLEENHEKAYISISDSGIGMTEADCLRLFDIKKSASREGTDGEKGSGIGLILTRELIKKNNGELVVRSAIGKGSTFKASFPLKEY